MLRTPFLKCVMLKNIDPGKDPRVGSASCPANNTSDL